jgi:hypothetical protein
MQFDNPAGRLKAILERGRQINHSTQCRTAWEELLHVKPADSDDLFSKLGKVMALPRQTLLLLQTNFPSQVEGAEIWRSQVVAALTNQNLAGQWATFIGQISPQCIAQLSLTAELIQARLELVPKKWTLKNEFSTYF